MQQYLALLTSPAKAVPEQELGYLEYYIRSSNKGSFRLSLDDTTRFRVHDIAQAIPEQIKTQDCKHNCQSGERGNPRRGLHTSPAVT